MPIVIVPPRADWAAGFAALKPALRRAAPADAVLHHIGSTAVPFLAAKDVIDVQVTVADLRDVDDAAFARAGFDAGPFVLDHAPAGLALPAAEWRKRFFRHRGRAAQVHVRAAGRFNQRYALLCRDFLRAHPVAAGAYGAIKQQLAARFAEDEDAYYAIKDPVCDLILAGAEAWARDTQWVLPPGD